jgi:hypothetical protein
MIVLRNKVYTATPPPGDNGKKEDKTRTNAKAWMEGLSGFNTPQAPELKVDPPTGEIFNDASQKNMSDTPMGIGYIGNIQLKQRQYGEERMPVSATDMRKAETDGVVQKRPDGKWGIIAKRKRLWWSAGYDSRESAEAALRAYHAGRH